MNELQVLHFKEDDVRMILDDQGERWWITLDVANVLGIVGTQTITERLDEDEQGFTLVLDARGIARQTSIISESGVYAAIARSNKPAAKEFQRWLRKDVIPSIRKYGTYSVTLHKTLPEMHRMFADELEKNAALNLQLGETKKQLAIAEPKADFYDALIASPSTFKMSKFAKMLKMYPPPGDERWTSSALIGRNTLFDILRSLKILMSDNEPYQDQMAAGRFVVVPRSYFVEKYQEERFKDQTFVTGKGMDYVRDRLLGFGCVPKKDRDAERAAKKVDKPHSPVSSEGSARAETVGLPLSMSGENGSLSLVYGPL